MTRAIPEIGSYVGDAWLAGDRVANDINPARPSEVVATAALADARIAGDAILAADRAFGAWRATPGPARGEILRKAGELIDARAADIARDLSREEGKTLGEALRETQSTASVFRYYAARTTDSDGEMLPSHRPSVLVYTRREPLGVVVAITPWNFPIMLPAYKIAPALAFGNTVVWKPADLTPLTAVHLMRALIDAGLPPGVLNLVIGKGSEVGDLLVTHPAVAAVSFTGSTAVGRAIQSRAAGKKVQLELGGKNPAIVLADADLDLAAEGVARGAFLSAGQKCTATSRVIVQRTVLGDLQERLVHRAETWTLGDPLDPATIVSPLASADQLRTVLGYIERALAGGATAVAGGGRPTGALADGFFVKPTVFTGAGPADPIASEEVFGPVAAILPVDSFEEAIALANDSPYGLTASLFTKDLGRALVFAKEIRSGVALVNLDTAGTEFHVPFGGSKESGSGARERGIATREFFTEAKSVYLNGVLEG
jgi:aldehyde dehydrogenase (NAD+)